MDPEELCKPNIYGIVHCWHSSNVDPGQDKPDSVLQLEVCCWCGKGKGTRHGLHVPKETPK